MQEDMRMKLPATTGPAEVQVDRVHIHVLPHRGSPVEQTASVACHHTPGQPVRLYLEDIKDHVEGWTLKPAPSPTLRERLNEIVDQRRARQGGGTHQPTVPPPAKVMPADALPVSSVAPVLDFKPAGPVYTLALVDGRMTVFRDGEPAPDSPWQLVMDAQQDERAEVRITIGMDTQGDGEAAYVAFWPEPGKPLVIRPEDWMPKASAKPREERVRAAALALWQAVSGDERFGIYPVAPGTEGVVVDAMRKAIEAYEAQG